jgi:hypothetical protein
MARLLRGISGLLQDGADFFGRQSVPLRHRVLQFAVNHSEGIPTKTEVLAEERCLFQLMQASVGGAYSRELAKVIHYGSSGFVRGIGELNQFN